MVVEENQKVEIEIPAPHSREQAEFVECVALRLLLVADC